MNKKFFSLKAATIDEGIYKTGKQIMPMFEIFTWLNSSNTQVFLEIPDDIIPTFE